MSDTDRIECTELRQDFCFSAKQTFECGQCFRWNIAPGSEEYIGVAFGTPARIGVTENGLIRIHSFPGSFQTIWQNYLDLDRDYDTIRENISIDFNTCSAAAFGAGIRILRQEPWEALCSFILSQCNNIPRIKGIVETLCRLYGEPLEFEGKLLYTFPDAERIATLDEAKLAPLRAGYRTPYVLAAARWIAEGRLNPSILSDMSTADAKKALMLLPGVGEKVASCVLLFGLHKLDAFPVDVWVRRALDKLYGGAFDPAAAFGEYAGVAQQYIFYHAREHARSFSSDRQSGRV